MHEPGHENEGFLTLQDLLPEGLLDPYDTSGFQDLLGAQFDTGLLDITKQAGRENIFNTMSQGQTSFMQMPSDTAFAGAAGFGDSGGGARGLINYQGAQRGMFGDVSEAMLGAKKSEMTALESLKDRAFNLFSDIQLDLDPKEVTDENNTYDNPTTGETFTFGTDGPIEGGTELYTEAVDPNTGIIWLWNGYTWSNMGTVPGFNQTDTESINLDDNITDTGDTDTVITPGGGIGGGGGCFLAGTMILTGDGSEIPIEDIKEGMEVYAFDKESGELKVSKVSQTFFHPKENTYLIVNDNLLVTPNHPVLNNNKWVEIGELEEGDMLTDKDNNPILISKIEEVDELSDVFNFEVEKYHTYVAEGIIVHNKNPGIGGGYGGGDDEGGDMGGDFFWPTGP